MLNFCETGVAYILVGYAYLNLFMTNCIGRSKQFLCDMFNVEYVFTDANYIDTNNKPIFYLTEVLGFLARGLVNVLYSPCMLIAAFLFLLHKFLGNK